MLWLLFTSAAALADRRELYTTFAFQPGLGAFQGPIAPMKMASRSNFSGELASFYGLTNALHVGGALSLGYGPDLRYPDVTKTLTDGSMTPVGVYFENAFSVGVSALLSYRLDTGFRLAPVARAEFGARWMRFVGGQLQPDGRDYFLDFESDSAVVPTAKVMLALEYRFSDRWLASVGAAYRRDLRGRAPWEFSIPLAIGLVW